MPTINYSLERKYITDVEAKILKMAIEKKTIQSSDLKEIFQGKHGAELSRQIRRLVDKKMLQRIGFKDYVISFGDNYLLRGIVKVLGDRELSLTLMENKSRTSQISYHEGMKKQNITPVHLDQCVKIA